MSAVTERSGVIQLPALHSGQRDLEAKSTASGARYRTAACGRRYGKSVFAQRLLCRAVFHKAPAAYFAQSYKLLEDTWRSVTSILKPAIVSSSRVEHRIELSTGGVLDGWTLDDRDAGRSRKYALAVIDEAGLCPHLGETWNSAIRPTLADYEGGAWFLGTPKGRGYFWDLFQRGQDPQRPEYFSYRATTHDNPYIKPAEIEAMRQSMTERSYRQEVLAEFLEDGGGVFRGVRTSAVATSQPAATPGHAYAIGCDWARSGDFSVFAVYDGTANAFAAIDRMTGVEYALQKQRLVALWERFGRPPILAEYNSIGGPMYEALQRDGLPVQPFVTTNATKAAIVEALALALERGQVKLLADETLISEFEAYESQRLPSGVERYSAPEGQHDDIVMACCLAYYAGASSGRWTGGNV